jgi:hypothetical protein
MDQPINDLYFQSRKDIRLYFMEFIRKVQIVKANDKIEEKIKKQFIKAFVNFIYEFNVYYPSEYDDFVKKIEHSLRDIIAISSEYKRGRIIRKIYYIAFIVSMTNHGVYNCNCYSCYLIVDSRLMENRLSLGIDYFEHNNRDSSSTDYSRAFEGPESDDDD